MLFSSSRAVLIRYWVSVRWNESFVYILPEAAVGRFPHGQESDRVSLCCGRVLGWWGQCSRAVSQVVVFICFLILTKSTDALAVSLQEAMIPLFLGDWKPICTADSYNHLSSIIICHEMRVLGGLHPCTYYNVLLTGPCITIPFQIVLLREMRFWILEENCNCLCFIAFILLSFHTEVLFQLELGLTACKQDRSSAFALPPFKCLERYLLSMATCN